MPGSTAAHPLTSDAEALPLPPGAVPPSRTFIHRIWASPANYRAVIGSATNATSSVGNLLLAVTIARSSSVTEFGYFALTFSIYVTVTGLCRAVVTDAALTTLDVSERHRAATRQISAIAAMIAVLVAAIGFLTNLPMMVILGLTFPGLCVYDHLKNVNLGAGASRRAFLQELTWTLLFGAGTAAVLANGGGAVLIFAVWATSGAAIGLIHAIRLGWPLTPGWRSCRRESRAMLSFGMQFLAGSGTAQLTTSLLATVAGAAVAGAVRAAGTVLAPCTLALTTARGMLIPIIARRFESNDDTAVQVALRLAAILTVLMAPLAAAPIFLPDDVGTFLLGESWKVAEGAVPALAGELLFATVTSVAVTAHRVLGRGFRGFAIEAGLAPFRLSLIVFGGVTGGVSGAALAMLAVAAVGTSVWWISFLRISTKSSLGRES